MNDQERRIWAAAYGAAFVAQYENTRKHAEAIPASGRGGELPSEIAVRSTDAEGPGYIADLAVIRYREWRASEKPTLGTSVES